MFDLIKFIQPAYLFDLRPYTTTQTIKVMVIFFAILIVIGIGDKIYKETRSMEKFQAKFLDKIVSYLISLGIIGLLLTWLRYERVQILSARFWLIVWLIIAICWLYPIIKYRIKVVPEATKRSEEKKQMQKYLPNKK